VAGFFTKRNHLLSFRCGISGLGCGKLAVCGNAARQHETPAADRICIFGSRTQFLGFDCRFSGLDCGKLAGSWAGLGLAQEAAAGHPGRQQKTQAAGRIGTLGIRTQFPGFDCRLSGLDCGKLTSSWAGLGLAQEATVGHPARQQKTPPAGRICILRSRTQLLGFDCRLSGFDCGKLAGSWAGRGLAQEATVGHPGRQQKTPAAGRICILGSRTQFLGFDCRLNGLECGKLTTCLEKPGLARVSRPAGQDREFDTSSEV